VIEDEKTITCDFFDSRHGFLRMCQGNNYQFDTLRRAKHSSMMILWHLHNPSIPAYAHICNVCENDIGCGTRWHCEACFDYDICEECYASPVLQHPHELVPKKDSHNILVELDEATGRTSPALALPPPANSLTRRGFQGH
jgi:E1A/CREB-binding protein